MSHTCSALIVHCIDFRLGPAISEYLKGNNLLGDCDVVEIAGAAKNFNGDVDQEVLTKQIQISADLHSIKKIILMNHTDCGAYGGRSAFASREDEDAVHFKALEHAAEVLKATLPDVDVVQMIAQIEDDGSIHIDSVS